jgi:trehalose 6-phosphate phosphatase
VTGGRASSPGSHLDPALRRLVVARPPLLVVTDFDGTLAAITLDPLATRIVPLARRALRSLAARAAQEPDRLRLVVLSGRTALDVAERVRVGGVAYWGNHGLESADLPRGSTPARMRVTVDPDLLASAPAARRLGIEVAEALGRPDWLFVEDKGPSVAFHFRGAADPAAARQRLEAAIAAARGDPPDDTLVAMDGRKVIEFRPVGAGGKGRAVERLIERERPGAVLALGDDVSDAEAFEAVREAREAGRIEGLTVGVHGAAETPSALLQAADVVLARPLDAARLLARLAAIL